MNRPTAEQLQKLKHDASKMVQMNAQALSHFIPRNYMPTSILGKEISDWGRDIEMLIEEIERLQTEQGCRECEDRAAKLREGIW